MEENKPSERKEEPQQQTSESKGPGDKSRPGRHTQVLYPARAQYGIGFVWPRFEPGELKSPLSKMAVEWGARGKEREQAKSVQYWRDIEAQLPQETREQILRTATYLQAKVDKRKLVERAAKEYIQTLYKTALLVDGRLSDAAAVTRALADPKFAKHLKFVRSAYNHFREANDLKAKLDIRVDRRRPLPTLTPENTLQAALCIPRQLRWTAYLRLAYEVGPRPIEEIRLRKQDVNFERQLIRLGTAKGSGDTVQRELPISPLCTEQLRTLTANQGPDDFVFLKTLTGQPIDHDDAYAMLCDVRRQLRQAGYNTTGLTLYVFRHAFATRLYNALGKIEPVSRALGHRSIEDTMIYIHLFPDQPKRFDVLRVELTDKEGVARQIAEGWELAVQTPEEIWFKRPRWVP